MRKQRKGLVIKTSSGVGEKVKAIFNFESTILILLFANGCYSSDDKECTPGDLRECTCSGGMSGIQECSEGGNEWETCQCNSMDSFNDQDVSLDSPYDLSETIPDPLQEEHSDPPIDELVIDVATDEVLDVASEDISGDWNESVHPCLIGGKVLYLNGEADDYVHPGDETIVEDARWSWQTETGHDSVIDSIDVLKIDIIDTTYVLSPWELAFATRGLDAPIELGLYENARRYPFEGEGYPGLDVAGEYRGCNRISGWFEVHELELDFSTEPASLLRFTASFEQHCEELPPALYGCVHFE